MNNVALKISKNLPLSFIYWLPRLVYLQLLWFLAVLPVVTLITASRAILDSLVLCQQQEMSLNNVGKTYKTFFLKRLQTYFKLDIVYEGYFLLMLADGAIFWQLGTSIGNIIFYAVILTVWLSILVFIYQTLLSKTKISFLYSFYILCKKPTLT